MGNYSQAWRASLGRNGIGSVDKFGFSTAIGTTEHLVWPDTGDFTFPPAAAIMKVTSASTVDQTGSTGALTVTVQGLDANYVEITDTVALNGPSTATPGLTSIQFLRINRAFVATAGAAETNVGNVYIGTGALTAGKPAALYAILPAGDAQTLQAAYTIPANKYGLMTLMKQSTSAAVKVVTIRLVAREVGGVFRTQEKSNLASGSETIEYHPPKRFAPKTDLEARAMTTTGTESVNAAFDIALVPTEST